MSRLPQEVISTFEQAPYGLDAEIEPTENDSIIFHEIDSTYGPEFVRGVGRRVVEETGYIITGMRCYGDSVELWLELSPHAGTMLEE